MDMDIWIGYYGNEMLEQNSNTWFHETPGNVVQLCKSLEKAKDTKEYIK